MNMKRATDFALSALALVVLSPWLLLIAVLVRLTSPGPALFRQLRVGRSDRSFVMLKFRTMTVLRDAEKGIFEAGAAGRVTPIGRILRRTKLDELPQLWNVLKGDMALVGPRPEVRKWVGAYPDHWKRILTVRPGMTDPGSIEFRNEEDILAAQADPETYYRDVILPRKLALYEKYVQTRSFWGDLGILLRTIREVTARKKSPKLK
jgi:lipopolysaccharide/colanic/teichoic acid biosynthesis glycosyltransferase